ncbi:MAG TPA: DUF4398 domain-containing protein [Steroidobacteraceae bacterium]|jgi:hypothetical protein|nr:DUF4398 domain-containing protein [Steroidobacteraceae bacterium]
MPNLTNLGLVTASTALLILAGCATTPVPEVAAARALVTQAEQSDTTQFASADLESARSKLNQAAGYEKAGKPVLAEQLAKESEADSEVAMARTRAIKAEKDLNDVNAGTQTLRSESRRNEGGDTTTVVVPAGGAVVIPSDSTAPQR